MIGTMRQHVATPALPRLVTLTAKTVNRLKAVGGKRTVWWDKGTRGFYVRVTPSGVRS